MHGIILLKSSYPGEGLEEFAYGLLSCNVEDGVTIM